MLNLVPAQCCFAQGGDGTFFDDSFVMTPSGLQYKDITIGTGSIPQKGDTVSVHYSGFFEDGRKFDSSYDRGKPLEFSFGRGLLIKGWEEGVAGMRVGGMRRLIIPPALAYGTQGLEGVIPPNSTLVFVVELLAITNKTSGRLANPSGGQYQSAKSVAPVVGVMKLQPSTSLSNRAIYSSGTAFIALWGLLVAGVIAFNKSAGGKYVRQPLSWSASGIEFGRDWQQGLLGRLKRDWSDLHAINFEGQISPGAIRDWKGLHGCTLTLDFKSGGGAVLELEHLSRDQVEKLLLCVEQSADQSVLSKHALFFERQLMAVDNDIPISYTTIWTDSLESQFGATHFVPLKTGSTLQTGRYEVRMQLASGGLSAVYLAQLHNGSRVILKESVLPLDSDQRTRAKAKEMFEREAAILAKLDHKQIARVLDFFAEEGRDYIVLEYIPGMSLRQVVQADPKRVRQNVVCWASQIANILCYLHELDPPIVHRDLTPDNLLIREDGKIALIDFGASNEFVSRATGTLVGKQAYIPPEQFRGKAEPKSDIYAFGATIYFLLVGKDPIPLSTSHPAQVSVAVLADIDELVASSTQLDPSSRPDAQRVAQVCSIMMKEVESTGGRVRDRVAAS
jgi:tRNA A-37 threonylcarbamoyl transferase component Bud32